MTAAPAAPDVTRSRGHPVGSDGSPALSMTESGRSPGLSPTIAVSQRVLVANGATSVAPAAIQTRGHSTTLTGERTGRVTGASRTYLRRSTISGSQHVPAMTRTPTGSGACCQYVAPQQSWNAGSSSLGTTVRSGSVAGVSRSSHARRPTSSAPSIPPAGRRRYATAPRTRSSRGNPSVRSSEWATPIGNARSSCSQNRR
jgi:hypothetical protein